jgi:NADP-dependent 3-hydroxy acid dehydrogenase YdfG
MENYNMAANGRFDAMTAVITGGASGIGCAVASRVIAEGGLVTLWDVDQAKLDAAQAKFGPKARAKRVDITNPEEVERAAKDADAAMGHIDILDQRFRSSNHIRPPCRAYRPRCERRAPD